MKTNEIMRDDLLRIVQASQFYKDRYDEKLMQRLAAACFEDFPALFHQLPFTQAEDMIRDPEAFLCVAQSKVQRVVSLTTSGTSGTRKKLFFTEGDLERTVRYFVSGMRCMVRSGETAGILFPGRGENGLPDLVQRALEELGVKAEKFRSEDIEAGGKFCAGKEFLVGLPQDILRIAEAFPSLRIRCALLSGQSASETLKQRLKDLWGCEVFEHYGLTETGFGLAADCPAHDMLHLRSDEVYAEVIDPITGEVLKNGEPGELVVTTFSAEAMPLIRYRTGDLVSMAAPGEICRCGFKGPMIKKIHGRRDTASLQSWKKSVFA